MQQQSQQQQQDQKFAGPTAMAISYLVKSFLVALQYCVFVTCLSAISIHGFNCPMHWEIDLGFGIAIGWFVAAIVISHGVGKSMPPLWARTVSRMFYAYSVVALSYCIVMMTYNPVCRPYTKVTQVINMTTTTTMTMNETFVQSSDWNDARVQSGFEFFLGVTFAGATANLLDAMMLTNPWIRRYFSVDGYVFVHDQEQQQQQQETPVLLPRSSPSQATLAHIQHTSTLVTLTTQVAHVKAMLQQLVGGGGSQATAAATESLGAKQDAPRTRRAGASRLAHNNNNNNDDDFDDEMRPIQDSL